ncbi:MAG TPA: hypothetical protein VL490_12205 [Mucilaginibacter sp.]|nr:hypothetical protein [Mucilaginibacter sp.]
MNNHSAKMLLPPHKGLCPAKQVKPRATAFCGYALSHPCKIPDAPATAQGHQFYLLSSEAVRLTDVHKTYLLLNNCIQKKRVKASSGRRAKEFCLVGCRNRPDLIFGYFGSSQSDKASAATERGKVCV